MCLLYLKVICARPWGPKEAFGDLSSPKTPLLLASFLRPKALKDPVVMQYYIIIVTLLPSGQTKNMLIF